MVCSFRFGDQEGLIEKVVFEKRYERSSGSKCKNPEVEACFSFLKYIKATSMSGVRCEVSRGRCIREKRGPDLVGPCNDFSFYSECDWKPLKALSQGLLCSHVGNK